MFEVLEESSTKLGAKIRVIGVGGGGCNAVNTMIKAGLSGVEYIVANTDAQALEASLAPTKIQLGTGMTKGLGAGANPDVGRNAALDEYERLSQVIEGADMIFITAGMGGGTGTGAAPVIAKLARDLGALTVGVVTKPFMFEGKKRSRIADEGLQNLKDSVDSLITIPNQKLLQIAGQNLSLVETFKKADEVLLNAVRGIADLINNTGHINADFADVRTVMTNKGLALMGTGFATGPDRAVKAATMAISSPLLEDISVDGATGIIINITGNSSLTMHETNEAVSLVMQAADEDAEIIFGTVIDDTLDDEVQITVIATGLEQNKQQAQIKTQTTSTQNFKVENESVQAVEVTTAKPSVKEFLGTFETETPVTTFTAPVEVKEEFKLDDFVSKPLFTESVEDEPIKTLSKDVEESPLMQSIREAASKYEQNKGGQIFMNSFRNENSTTQKTTTPAPAKGKSIAEKLGFIDFDEDELDMPSYIRKDQREQNLDI